MTYEVNSHDLLTRAVQARGGEVNYMLDILASIDARSGRIGSRSRI
jgi:hypothetical protein